MYEDQAALFMYFLPIRFAANKQVLVRPLDLGILHEDLESLSRSD
jgi:hypothetical protein